MPDKKIFYSFSDVLKERAEISSFVELQYCKAKPNEKIKRLVSVNFIKFRQEDSLCVLSDDMYEFLEATAIFSKRVYNNLKTCSI